MSEPTYYLYLDDSGTKEYGPNPDCYGVEAGSLGNSRYFVFGGLLIPSEHAPILAQRISDLKFEYFGSRNVEIKSNWLRFPNLQEKKYLKPFGIDLKRLTEFTDEYYRLINDSDLMFLACVVDKKHMQNKYPRPHYDPALAYEGVLQRVQNEIQDRGTVLVTIDDMHGKTPAGNEYKSNLRRQHQNLQRHGSRMLSMQFSCLNGDLRFQGSHVSHLLQVADIAAYNVYRQFVDHGEQWEQRVDELQTYPYLARMLNKFRQDSNGRIQGYGVVKFPITNRVGWGIKK